ALAVIGLRRHPARLAGRLLLRRFEGRLLSGVVRIVVAHCALPFGPFGWSGIRTRRRRARFRLDPLARKEKRRNRGGSGVGLVAGARNHFYRTTLFFADFGECRRCERPSRRDASDRLGGTAARAAVARAPVR